MKALIESALARHISAHVKSLATAVPSHEGETLPDTGTSLVVTAEIDHRAGPAYVADVSFLLASVVDEDTAESQLQHREHERAILSSALDVDWLDCGLGVIVHGHPFHLSQSGNVEGNRFSSEIRIRYGVTG